MAIEDFRSIEFGICSIIEKQEMIVRIPIDDSVRKTLFDMHEEFYNTYLGIEDAPALYEPSEKYASTEKLQIELLNENLDVLRNLYNQNNIPVSEILLPEIANSIIYYFGIFYHINGTKQIAVKRPSQFKGLLKNQTRLMSLIDDTLYVIPDKIFKLDIDFDFIIHQDIVDILHPTGFATIADIDEEILRTAAAATRQLSSRISFINFNYLSGFVGHSKKAAKLIASIKAREDLERTSLVKLRDKCVALDVTIIDDNNGKIIPSEDCIIRFLQVLDRREYDVDLTVDNISEIYVAASRKKVN